MTEHASLFPTQTNTFQTVLISNGTKAYSVFTYVCDTMKWSDEATIGFNAGGSYYQLHPLSGRIHSSAIDCVHTTLGQNINNVVYDLAPTTPEGTQPPPVETCKFTSCVISKLEQAEDISNLWV